jgi:hypothetical protein
MDVYIKEDYLSAPISGIGGPIQDFHRYLTASLFFFRQPIVPLATEE